MFITTSKFSKEALTYVDRTGDIVLVNGERLAELMIQFNVGVSEVKSYAIKRIDTDYFEDDLI